MDITDEKSDNNGDIADKNAEKNLWKDLVSQSLSKKTKFDVRTEVVVDALREKLNKVSQVRDKTDIEVQLEKSETQLEELISFGNELVNNLKAANEQHELLRSKEKSKKEEELEAQLCQEAEISLKQLDAINDKWIEMNSLKEPMAIHEDIQKQRENVENLMASKDDLINQCQKELKRINQKYYDDQNIMSQDICILVERIDRLIEDLKKCYRSNIHDLQQTINTEKVKVLQAAQDKWNTVYDHLTVNETEKMEMVKEKRNYYAQEVENIRNKQEEITRNTRTRLEKDAEMLELEIRKTRANILMNSEKIDYNYQVLQKRNEENIIINNQQKRRVAKFNESIAVLRRKLHELRENNRQTMEKLTLDIQKLHASINELQMKADNFRKNNKIKLYKVWSINFKEVKHLLARVFEIDRILYEQQLGRNWMAPIIDLNALDLTYEMPSFLNKATEKYSLKSRETIKPTTKAVVLSSKRFLHDILRKISDRAGFLVEEKIFNILKPYTDEQKCLVKIESVFSALNINDTGMVNNLIKYFEPYSCCPNCKTGLTENALKSLYSFNKEHSNLDSIEPESSTAASKNNKYACKNHILYMEPALVLTALNDFISKEMDKTGKTMEIQDQKKKNAIDLNNFDNTQIINYWKQFSSYMTPEQQNVWKSIEHGLNHYLEVLKKRSQIDRECVFLQKQNAELKHLLQKL